MVLCAQQVELINSAATTTALTRTTTIGTSTVDNAQGFQDSPDVLDVDMEHDTRTEGDVEITGVYLHSIL
jgi:hypothetical protein